MPKAELPWDQEDDDVTDNDQIMLPDAAQKSKLLQWLKGNMSEDIDEVQSKVESEASDSKLTKAIAESD